MHRSRDNDSKALSRNSSATSLEQRKVSVEELPMLLESNDIGRRRNDGLYYSMVHHEAIDIVDNSSKRNEGDMDNVYKSLQLLNDHLSQFQSSVVVGKSGCDENEDEVGDVKRKGDDDTSSYDDNGHVIVSSASDVSTRDRSRSRDNMRAILPSHRVDCDDDYNDDHDDDDDDDDSNVNYLHEQYDDFKEQMMHYKKKKKKLDNDAHASSRDDVDAASFNDSAIEATGNSARIEKEQKSRVRRQIEESIRFNTQQQQQVPTTHHPHPHPSSHNHSHHHIHHQPKGDDNKSGQLQLRRMGALAAALDAGDAVGKLMAEMLISSR